jgi:hypothetical protein
MKTKQIKTVVLFLFTILFFSCNKEDLESQHSHAGVPHKNEISFKQFKAETGITKFDYIKTANINRSTDLMARDIEAEFVTDTIGIKKYVNPVDSKTTYSFKIYPVSQDLNSNEYYNLVYEKIGTEWNEIIFYNIEKTNPTHTGELESSEMVYNRMSARAGYAIVVSYNVVCTNNAYCIKRGSCDGLTCETGECLQTTISYVWVGFEDTGNQPGGNPPSSGSSSGEGGGNDSGIYIPNPYEGDVAIDNLDFLLAGQVASFTSTLAPNLQTLIANTPFIYPYLVDFCRKNGGRVGIQNRQQMVQALTNYHNFQLNSIYPNLTSISINRLNLWAFYSFLNNNPLNANTTKINVIKDFIIDAEFDTANEIVDYLYENREDDEAIDFGIDVIDVSNDLDIDAMSIWINDYDSFRAQMSNNERELFDDLLPNRKMWYMVAAKKAIVKSQEIYPNDLHNGKGDALRHAIWNGLSSLLIGADLTNELTSAHENRPPTYVYSTKENAMDLYNNSKGRFVATYSNISNVIDNILLYCIEGNLMYLNNLNSQGFATSASILIPTNQ